MKKITGHVNDVNLKEVTELVNQLESYKDDSGFGIALITIDGKAEIDLHPDLFFAKFFNFKARKLENENYTYPYEFRSQIDGVTFVSLLSESCLKELQNTSPIQFDFINQALEESIHAHKKSLQALECK